MSSPIQITQLAQYFLVPANPTHRQYEALRAYFVEGFSAAEVAERFGYTPGSFRVLAHHFRHDPQRAFFLPTNKGPHAPIQRLALRDRVSALRKQILSIYDISRPLQADGHPISPVAIDHILKAEGFARLPRRAADDRPPAARA